METANEACFWFVWNASRGLPKHKHATEKEARDEAYRLAIQHAGEKFYVLRSEAHIAFPRTSYGWNEHVQSQKPTFYHDSEDLPF